METDQGRRRPPKRGGKTFDEKLFLPFYSLRLPDQYSRQRFQYHPSSIRRSNLQRADHLRDATPKSRMEILRYDPPQHHRLEPVTKKRHQRLVDQRIIRFDRRLSGADVGRTAVRLIDQTELMERVSFGESVERIGRRGKIDA